MRQRNLNLLIGNSSVAHMGLVFLGIASLSLIGVTGAVLVMVAHGFLAALTFGLSGYLYQQTGTLEMDRLGGLLRKLPFLGTAMMMAMLAGCGVPGFANFAGEILVLFGTWKGALLASPQWFVVLATWGALIIGAVYMLRAIRRIFHGPLRRTTDFRSRSQPVAQAAVRVVADRVAGLRMFSALVDRQDQAERRGDREPGNDDQGCGGAGSSRTESIYVGKEIIGFQGSRGFETMNGFKLILFSRIEPLNHCSSGRESALSEFEKSQSRLTSAATRFVGREDVQRVEKIPNTLPRSLGSLHERRDGAEGLRPNQIFARVRWLFPLLEGEGQGESEQAVLPIISSQICTDLLELDKSSSISEGYDKRK